MNLTERQHLLRQYQIDALKTALRTERSKDLLIRTNGLAGEWGEFLHEPPGMPLVVGAVPTTRGGELADVAWYAAAVAEVCGVQLADLAMQTFPDFDLSMLERETTIAIAGVCEFAKKTAGHGREKPVTDMTKHLRRVLEAVMTIAGDELPILLAANVEKLRERHRNAGPGGFDPNYGKPPPVIAQVVIEVEGSPSALMRAIGEKLRENPGCLGHEVIGFADEASKPIDGTDLHSVIVTRPCGAVGTRCEHCKDQNCDRRG